MKPLSSCNHLRCGLVLLLAAAVSIPFELQARPPSPREVEAKVRRKTGEVRDKVGGFFFRIARAIEGDDEPYVESDDEYWQRQDRQENYRPDYEYYQPGLAPRREDVPLTDEYGRALPPRQMEYDSQYRRIPDERQAYSRSQPVPPEIRPDIPDRRSPSAPATSRAPAVQRDIAPLPPRESAAPDRTEKSDGQQRSATTRESREEASRENVESKSQTKESTAKPGNVQAEYASPVPGRAGMVYPPGLSHDPGNMVDVRGLSAGQKVRDPRTGKVFLVP